MSGTTQWMVGADQQWYGGYGAPTTPYPSIQPVTITPGLFSPPTTNPPMETVTVNAPASPVWNNITTPQLPPITPNIAGSASTFFQGPVVQPATPVWNNITQPALAPLTPNVAGNAATFFAAPSNPPMETVVVTAPASPHNAPSNYPINYANPAWANLGFPTTAPMTPNFYAPIPFSYQPPAQQQQQQRAASGGGSGGGGSQQQQQPQRPQQPQAQQIRYIPIAQQAAQNGVTPQQQAQLNSLTPAQLQQLLAQANMTPQQRAAVQQTLAQKQAAAQQQAQAQANAARAGAANPYASGGAAGGAGGAGGAGANAPVAAAGSSPVQYAVPLLIAVGVFAAYKATHREHHRRRAA